MKRISYIWLATTVLAGATVSLAGAQSPASQAAPAQAAATPTSPVQTSAPQTSSVQAAAPQTPAPQAVGSQSNATAEPSLGSYARTVRKDKKALAAKQFDNDNLPTDTKLSVVGGSSAAAPPALPGSAQAAGNAPQMPQAQPGQSVEQRQVVYDQWQQRITGQQQQVDLLSRELDVAQREYRLRAAAMYGDAGDRLRNEAAWDKEDADYKQKIAEKQKAVDEAKQKLSEMQEEARKAGVPSSSREAQSAEDQEKQ